MVWISLKIAHWPYKTAQTWGALTLRVSKPMARMWLKCPKEALSETGVTCPSSQLPILRQLPTRAAVSTRNKWVSFTNKTPGKATFHSNLIRAVPSRLLQWVRGCEGKSKIYWVTKTSKNVIILIRWQTWWCSNWLKLLTKRTNLNQLLKDPKPHPKITFLIRERYLSSRSNWAKSLIVSDHFKIRVDQTITAFEIHRNRLRSPEKRSISPARITRFNIMRWGPYSWIKMKTGQHQWKYQHHLTISSRTTTALTLSEHFQMPNCKPQIQAWGRVVK